MSTQTMTPEIYESKRNDLIELLDSILTTATGLSAAARKELEETAAKLKRNSFEIVLVGEFQGGKSTTFDTICDGREISPRGMGIKTSACKISAQSVPADQPERAELTWKSDEELMLTMIGIIRDNLVNDKDAYALFTKKDANDIDILPSLSDPRIHELAKKAIHAEWERYNADRVNYDKDGNGKLDLLKISTLILNFCNSPELAELKANPSITIDNLKPLMVFPQEWELRWMEGGENAQWSFSEVPFVFLGSASCLIHCKNLERLGCVITDCPGLFAGPWDTAVAQKAMMQADAILYLIGGQKAVTEADLRALTEIRKTQQGHKVFFAINAKQSKANIAGPIRQVDFSMIQQRGYELANAESIDVFNSLLAFDSKTTPADEKRWKKEVSSALASYLALDLTDEDDLLRAKELRENRPELYKASDFPSILAKIETDVVTKKFESILVRGGTDKASAALDALNGDLIAKEVAADKDKAAVETEVQSARTKLKEFQDFVTKKVSEELANVTAADQVANDFIREVFENNIDNISSSIADVIIEQFDRDDTMRDLGWRILKSKLPFGNPVNGGANDAKSILSEPIGVAMNSITEPAIEGWINNVRAGQNDVFNLAYGRALDNVVYAMREKWDSTYNTEEGFLSGLAPNFDWDIAKIAIGEFDPLLDSIDVQKEAFGALKTRILANVKAIVVTIVGVIVVEVLLAVFAGILIGGVIPIVAAIATGAGFYEWFKENAMKKVSTQLRPSLAVKLREVIRDNSPSIKQSFKDSILVNFISEMNSRCQHSLSDQLSAFESRVKETLALKEEVGAKQKIIAAEAKNVREEQIDPARKQIAEFHEGLQPFFESEPSPEA